jgi:AraC-like DNA-binding protein
MDNYLTPYNQWNVTLPSVAPHSRLYRLERIGVGTPEVESVTGHMKRLAAAHSVSLGTLMIHEVLPLFGRTYLTTTTHRSLRAFWDSQSQTLNGISVSTHDMVQVLQNLTQNNDMHLLTMLPWRNVLPPRGLLRRTSAWCPLCYQAWHERGQIVYEPLLWALEVVTVCLHHHRRLSLQCPSCQRAPAVLAAQARIGHCPHCHTWLGTSPADSGEPTVLDPDMEQECWTTAAVGSILATTPTLREPPPRERIAEVMTALVQQADTISTLARHMGLSRRSILDCQRGEQLLQLDTLLHVCRVLELAPMTVLTLGGTAITTLQSAPHITSPRQQTAQRYRAFDIEGVRQDLEAAFACADEPPASLRTVARQLGYDQSHLRKHLPDECTAIVTRYQTYVQHRREQRWERLCTELRQVMRDIHAAGVYPGFNRIAEQFSQPWFLREPQAKEVWRATLCTLGWSDSVAEIAVGTTVENRTHL